MSRGAKRSKARPTPRPARARRSRPDVRLAEALAQQEATSEILRVISQSPGDTEPVFEAIVRSAARLCDAEFSAVVRLEGGLLHLAAISNMSAAETTAYHSLFPRPARRDFIIGRAFLDGRPVHVEDVLEDPEYDPHTLAVLQRAAQYRSYIGVPIVRHGVTIGAIGCGRHQRKPFTAAQIELVKTFADQAVIAIENVRLFTELEARNAQLTDSLEQQTATAEILRAISASPTDLQPVLDTVVQAAARFCGAPDVAILRVDGDVLRGAASVGPFGAALAAGSGGIGSLELPVTSGSVSGRAVLRREVVHVHDLATEPEHELPVGRDLQRRFGHHTILAAPLLREGIPLGAIVLFRTEVRAFSDRQMELLQTFAAQAVIAIENVRLFTEVQERNRALTESLQQQTATSDILRVISSSPTDIQPVFDTMARSAATLCEAFDASIFRVAGDRIVFVGHYGPIAQGHGDFSLPLVRGTVGGRSVLEGRTVQVADLQAEAHEFPDAADNARRFGFHTILSVPLMRDGVAIGGIQLRRTATHPFTERHITLLQTFADQAVIAIENVRLFTEVQERNHALTEALDQQTATSDILRVISSSPTDVQPVFEIIAERAVRLCGAQVGVVSRFDGAMLQLAAIHGTTSEGVTAVRGVYPMPPDADTITARTYRERAVVHVEDVLTDSRYAIKSEAQTAGWRAGLAAPMMRDGQVIGIIFVGGTTPERFSGQRVELLKTFADQAVIAIENVRLFRELEVRNRDLTETLDQQTATGEILRVISSSPTDVQPVFETIARNARHLCNADSGAVYTYDGRLIHLHALDNTSPEGAAALRAAYPIEATSGSAGGQALLTGREVHIPDARHHEGYQMHGLLGAGLRSLLAVPMLRGGTPVGVIVVHTWEEPRPFTTAQIDLLRTFADQAVIAIENTRLFRELEVRNRDLTESLDQQTATGEILRVISSSPTDVQPVFDTIVESAVRLCDGIFSAAIRREGDQLYMVGQHNWSGEGLAMAQRLFPMPLSQDHVTARAVREARTIHLQRIQEDATAPASSRELAIAQGYQTLLVVPMLRETQAVGAIVVTRVDGPFSETQIALLQTFADQAVIAIQNVRLFTEVQERNRALTESLEQQTATGEILKVISSSPTDVQPVFDTIVESAVRLCDGIFSALFRYDGELIHQVAQHNFSPESLEEVRRLYPTRPSRDHGSARAILERTIVHIPDVETDPEFRHRHLTRTVGLRSALYVPMMREGQPIGVVMVARSEPGAFSEAHVSLLQTFADQAVIAIENVRLFTEVQERNRALTESLEQQTATGEILRVISSSPTDVQPVFDTIAESAMRLCEGQSSQVFRYEEGQLHFVAARGRSEAAVQTIVREFPRPADTGSSAGRAILSAAVAHIPDVHADAAYDLGRLARVADYRAIVAVPMLREGRAVGAIAVARVEPGAFSDRQIDLLRTFADQAVIAIENVRLFTELDARNTELTTALEQQTATADVLRMMSASAADAQPVFDAIVRNAARLCHARFALAYELVDDVIHFVSQHNLPPTAAAQFLRTFPQRLSESGTLIARAILRGEVINVPDILADTNVAESVRELARSSGYRSVIAVPIMREGRALGALAITRSDPREDLRPFSEDEIPILQTFTEQAGIAIENVRLFNELEARTSQLTRSVGELQALGEVSQAVGSTLDLDAVLETIVGRAAQLSGSDQGVIYEFDDAGQTFHQRATHGMSTDYVRVMETAPIRIGEGAIGRAAITRQPVEIVDMQKDSQLLAAQVREQLIRQDMGSLLALPLVREERILGGLVIIRRQRGAFSPDVVAMLKTFAAQSVLAIHNARLFREIQRQKQYSDTLMETSPVAIVTLDLAGVVTSWNPGAERLFGHSPAEALGQSMEDLVSTPEGREEVRANIRQTLDGQWIQAMGRRARKDGTRVDLEISSVPVIVEGARVGMIAIYHDITELLKAREEAETANEAKSAFLATMSHEIRTPMNAVIGMSGLLLNTRLSEEQRDYAEVIRQSGDTLLTVINDILDFSKIEAGRLELEAQPFDLRECVEGALDLVATRAAEKGVDLAYLVGDGVPPGVIGDVTRLRQVLLNLLSNAVKFTDRGEVVLSVAARPPARAGAPHELAFSVRDTGIGIPADRLDRLFQSFSQVDASTTRRYGGTGLGLAISQRLTEMMGGKIAVTSCPGAGSEFSFSIRAHASDVPVRVHRDLSGVQPTLRGKRVLVVDDNATNRRIVTVHLDTWGMPSRATESPLEALEWLKAGEHFDLAILDMHMPEMDGVSLARALRTLPAGAGLPLILFTSLGRREARAEDEGFAAYLHKPIKPSQLFDALSSVLADQPVHVAARGTTAVELDPELAARHPLRILLAEDNVVNQKVALRLLAQMGYRADVAANGLEAIEAVARQTYDVVLMDVQMPELDGFEASREINRRWSGGRPRIVAMTANAMQGDRELCVAAGMDDYVAKPIRIEELVAALRRVPPHREVPVRTAAAVSPAPGAPAEAVGDGAGAIDRAVFDRLGATTGGPFVTELIDTFGEDARELLAALRRALAGMDVDAFRRAAHSLKSTAESLGAVALGALARELEGHARAGSLEGAAQRLDRLEQHYARAAGALGDLRRDLSA